MKFKTKDNILQYVILIIASFIALYPFYWLLVGVTLTNSEIFGLPPKLTFGSNFFINYNNLVNKEPIWQTFKNSLFISGTYTILTVYISGLTGYAFAKFNFKGKNILFGLILMSMMLPLQVTLIPLFKISIKLGWVNSAKAIIIPALANIFGVFFMKQNMMSVPDEIIESGRVDGANEIRIFHQLVLPIQLPAIAALGILSFINQWGNFLWPLIILNNKDYTTLPVLISTIVEAKPADYGQVFVAILISITPVIIVFLSLQKYFISGIYGGSVKG
ncbi:carbohydrate ABC transporter permease [Oceanivirga salmonicida]|uniref:carbohydrate ABC transporter permease n=1 Tax=Oceanivirga salmonicida TaxID=1769291 RepID=UPI0008310FCC|nr:carbohydrate ABC transporter permease [Oceanivirga salmonicida]